MTRTLILAIVAALAALLFAPASAAAKVKIIFDTDFGGDADDLGALAMLHGFVERKEADLLAIMVWSTEASAVPAIDAVNRYYGHPNIPIGARSGPLHTAEWNYSKAISDKLPNRLNAATVPEATALYRKILAENRDRSIVLVTVGPLLNIKRLIESGPDAYSPLSGKELLNRKVKQVVVMGGQYPQGKKEWNFWGDMPGVTRFVFDNVDRPVVFLGYEIGDVIRTGAPFNDIDPGSPLYLGFLHFSEHASWMKERFRGRILDNATFDQTAVLYAVRGGLGRYWTKGPPGRNEIDEEGNNRWIPGRRSNQTYMVLRQPPETMARLIESLMLWDVNPRGSRGGR
jgi:hypothetical protein